MTVVHIARFPGWKWHADGQIGNSLVREYHRFFPDEWNERRIVVYASNIYLLQAKKMGENYPLTAEWITDSIRQMTSDELMAIKTYRSKHPEQQQIAAS